jgi:hypothetical protein
MADHLKFSVVGDFSCRLCCPGVFPCSYSAAFIVNRYYYTTVSMFTFSDVVLLARKIAVGILLTLIPFVLIAGGIWLAVKLFN